MEDDYMPPKSLINSWARECSCCPECNPHPCDGVMAGGMCDQMPCECGQEYEDYPEDPSSTKQSD